MKRIIAIAVLAGLILAGNSTLKAGENIVSFVSISLTNRGAAGALGSARSSSDDNQYIGCSAIVSLGASQVTCEARDVSGTAVMCASSNDSLVRAALALSSISAVSFNWDENGVCTSIEVVQFSYFAPMVP